MNNTQLIVNPKNNKYKYHINSKYGNKILGKYIKNYIFNDMIGGTLKNEEINRKITKAIMGALKILKEFNLKTRIKIYKEDIVPLLYDLIDPNKISNEQLSSLINKSKDLWGLYPGTQIYYGYAFQPIIEHLQHHGVYIGFGLVVEVGSGWCTEEFKEHPFRQCIGIVSLDRFVSRKGYIDPNKDIYQVVYPNVDITNPSILRGVYTRIIEIIEDGGILNEKTCKLGSWDYNPFNHNCQHFSSHAVNKGQGKFTQFFEKEQHSEPFIYKKSDSCSDKECNILYRLNKDKETWGKKTIFPNLYYRDNCQETRQNNCYSYETGVKPEFVCSKMSNPGRGRRSKIKYHPCLVKTTDNYFK